MKNLKFYKEFDCAIPPHHGTHGSAGLDFFIPVPDNTNDYCFEYMRNRCIEKVVGEEDEIKTINNRFDTFLEMHPEAAFWNAVLLYNKYIFNNVLKTPIVNTNSVELFLDTNENITIPCGLSVDIPDGYALDFVNKSGIATKSLIVGACLIDSDYTGIMHINIHNIGNKKRTLKCGQKIVQAIILKTYVDEFEYSVVDGKNKTITERGSGGFGSTGTMK